MIEKYKEKPADYSLEKWKEYRRIIGSFDFYELSNEERQPILEALHSDKWDWFADCDGCTCVSEPGWPSKYYPPCVLHDFRWMIGESLWRSNMEFRKYSKIYKMESWRANIRWFGVTVATPFAKVRNWIFGTPAER